MISPTCMWHVHLNYSSHPTSLYKVQGRAFGPNRPATDDPVFRVGMEGHRAVLERRMQTLQRLLPYGRRAIFLLGPPYRGGGLATY